MAESIIKYCQTRIQTRMNLKTRPDISVKIRKFEGPDGGGRYKIQPSEWNVIESSEFWCEKDNFNRVKRTLEEEYPQLHKDTDRNIPFNVYLIEPIVCFGSSATKISGGFTWDIMGVLKNGEKYCVVLYVEVRPLLRRCGLMSLMKKTEIGLAKSEKCDFIQTWHMCDNPDFNAAIAPSLKRGFILYHGPSRDGDKYEDKGYIHLRYYFDQRKRKNIRVLFKDGKEFMSPEDNDTIIHYLESCPDKYPGRTIRSIEEYGQANTKVNTKKPKQIKDIAKEGSDKKQIFIAEGSAGFEYTRQRNTYRIGDIMSFCPAICVDHCEESDQNKPYMKHIIYNIYEFNFKPISMASFEYPDGTAVPHYVLEISPDFKLFHSTLIISQRRCLKVDLWYKGYGRLFICDHRYSAYNKTTSLKKENLRTGKLISISDDLIQRDFSTTYSKQVKQFRYGKKGFCDEDALEWFGYYRDLDEFKNNISEYIKNPVEYESTDSPRITGYCPELIFCIELPLN